MLSDYGDDVEEEDGQDTDTDTDASRGRPIGATTFTVASLIAYVAGAYAVGPSG